MKFSEITAGRCFTLGPLTVDRDEVIAFATRYDDQWFHTDPDAAAQGPFQGLIASGWHTCALAMRLTVQNFLHEASSMGSPGLESLRWLKPVYPGDTLRLQQVITESRALRTRPDVGLVRSRWEMFNQNGEQVLAMEGYGMFRRRHPATQEEIDLGESNGEKD